jgi:hypothetical protein
MSPRRSPRHQDLLRLSVLASRPDSGSGTNPHATQEHADLAAVLLRVQADLFAAAPVRDTATTAAFETLALTLLPKADRDTLAYVAAQVRNLPETPRPVLSLLVADGIDEAPPAGSADTARALAGDDPAIDLALARDLERVLGPQAWSTLIRRATRRRDLAQVLLERPDIPALHAATLYRDASTDQRAHIRAELGYLAGLQARKGQMVRPTQEATQRLIVAAQERDVGAFGALLASGLGLPTPPLWRFGEPQRHDFLALALLALGISEEACIRIFLKLDHELACDTTAVFHLVELFRRTPRSVACLIIEAAYDITIQIPGRGEAIAAQRLVPPFGRLRNNADQRVADTRTDASPARQAPARQAPARDAPDTTAPHLGAGRNLSTR